MDIFKDFKFDVIKLLEGEHPPPPPRVLFSTFQSWSEVADWYAQLEHDRRVPTPEIRAKADEVARGKQTDEAKAQALYYWVSENIRYVVCLSASAATSPIRPPKYSRIATAIARTRRLSWKPCWKLKDFTRTRCWQTHRGR